MSEITPIKITTGQMRNKIIESRRAISEINKALVKYPEDLGLLYQKSVYGDKNKKYTEMLKDSSSPLPRHRRRIAPLASEPGNVTDLHEDILETPEDMFECKV